MPSSPAQPTADELAALLRHIEASPAFLRSERHRRLLRHLVERTLAGQAATLKESLLAVEVFGRSATSFDPQQDTIVRVELRRLRQRLVASQQPAALPGGWQIALPPGSYVPVFTRRPSAATDASRAARDLVERGEHFLRQPLSRETLVAALERFDAALADSPRLAAAHVGRARALLNLATGWHRPPREAAQEADAALRQALSIEPAHAVALALHGALLSQFLRDWPAARRAFEKARASAPGEAFVHSAFGSHLQMHGHVDDAEQVLQQARRLDPHYVNTRMHLVNLRMGQRRWDEAQRELDGLVDLAGPTLATLGLRAALCVAVGDTEGALHAMQALHAQLPGNDAVALSLASVLAMAGDMAAADALAARCDLRQVSPYVQAVCQSRRGQTQAALAHLEEAIRLHDPLVIQAPNDPSFDALHGCPEWTGLALRARLPSAGTDSAAG